VLQVADIVSYMAIIIILEVSKACVILLHTARLHKELDMKVAAWKFVASI